MGSGLAAAPSIWNNHRYPVPGLVPGIHVLLCPLLPLQDVDGRDKPGHGEFFVSVSGYFTSIEE